MLQMFLSSLEEQLGLIVDPPLAPVVRMNIITEEIDMLARAAQLPLEPTKSIHTASPQDEEKCLFCHEYDCRCADYDRAQYS